jgi:hypothetical protein
VIKDNSFIKRIKIEGSHFFFFAFMCLTAGGIAAAGAGVHTRRAYKLVGPYRLDTCDHADTNNVISFELVLHLASNAQYHGYYYNRPDLVHPLRCVVFPHGAPLLGAGRAGSGLPLRARGILRGVRMRGWITRVWCRPAGSHNVLK